MGRSLKHSGVDWIGNIPSDWDMSRIGATFDHVKEKNTNREETNILSLMKDIGVIPYSEKGAVGNNASEDIERYYLVEPNDIVMNSMNVIIGSVGKSRYKGCLSQVYHVLRIRDKEEDFVDYYDYLFATRQFQRKLVGYGNGILEHRMRIPMSKLKIVDLPKPRYVVQSRIANYLDKKVEKINELIQVQEDTIVKFEEYKQSVITYSVTKGLNIDCDMRHSGYEIVGEIPFNWGVTKVRRLLSMAITDGPHETPTFQETGIPFLSAEAIKNDKLDFEKIRGYISEDDYLKYSEKYIPRVNDIYMVKSGATTGNIAQVEKDIKFTIWSPLAVFRCNDLVHHRYLFYSLKSDTFKRQVENKWSYGTQQNIGMRVLETLLVPYGSIDKQIEIAEFLDKITQEINQLIQIKKDKIEKLHEYKKSLIYEAVTGKIEVM